MIDEEERCEKMKKILYITLISLLLISSLANNVLAKDRDASEIYNVIENPETYKPATLTSATDANQLKNMANGVIGALQIVGTVLSVAMLGILGIKYMMGSVDERAEYKKTLRPYLIGAFMVFGITNILALVIKMIEVLF